MVVKKLIEMNNTSAVPKRILVLLPKCYVQKVIPNNTQKKKKFMKLPPEDKVYIYPCVCTVYTCKMRN